VGWVAIDQAADLAEATGPAGAAVNALEAATSRVALAEAGMPSAVVPEDSTERARAPIAAAVLPAWDLEAVVAVVVAGGADSPWSAELISRSNKL
jgi:hypothetical protein